LGMIRVCPGEIGKPSRMTSPRGLESITRDLGRLQNGHGFMLFSLLPLHDKAAVFAPVCNRNDFDRNLLQKLQRRSNKCW
jgi:hypothetical protein